MPVMAALLRIDWNAFLFGDKESIFLLEVLLRAVVMFLIILSALRILGKRSVAQLSVFELGVIIGLGSAAGDPMFYNDVGILPALLVFNVVIVMSRLLTWIINHSNKAEKLLEGEPVYLIKDGELLYQNFKQEPVAQNELFSQLRMHSVSQLGQVAHALIETNGSISLFFFEDKDVRWGMPVLPHQCENRLQQIARTGYYACARCSHVEELTPGAYTCKNCDNNKWLPASKAPRIS